MCVRACDYNVTFEDGLSGTADAYEWQKGQEGRPKRLTWNGQNSDEGRNRSTGPVKK